LINRAIAKKKILKGGGEDGMFGVEVLRGLCNEANGRGVLTLGVGTSLLRRVGGGGSGLT
jgi:hypothetical protein